MRFLFPLLALAVALPLHAQDAPEASGVAAVYDIVEEPPEIVGGLAALTARVVYPDSAQAAGIGGVVYVSAVVDTSGIAREAVVRRAPDPSLGAAAVVALNGLEFTPGRIGGLPVPTRVTMPIRFEPPPLASEIESSLHTPAQPLGGWQRLRSNVEWPIEAIDASVEGVITVAIAVGSDGKVADVTVVESNVLQDGGQLTAWEPSFTGGGREGRARTRPTLSQARRALERALIRAVNHTQFIPAIRDGEAVSSTVPYALEFILND
ncbi:TonB family protein [Rubricoccus marinus]|uniref:TonB C-terminal domain-containing protein n=1 Tax=Rubricoccus marinus TaxID=716817 RepID=A0A259TW01_9BACT|nr:TonB family protein [Rubricoccus marinus]OZC01952.1 hypothetical protein BSZ36_02515 [Rubricoccus marinus]